MIDLDDLSKDNIEYLVAMNIKVNETSWIWHSRLRHASMDSIIRLIKKDLVRGLSKLNFEKNKICNAYQVGKQIRSSFKSKNIILISRPLNLLHMDFFGVIKTTSLGRKHFSFVIP